MTSTPSPPAMTPEEGVATSAVKLGTPTLNPHWIAARVLAGFMDRSHVEQVVGEWLNDKSQDFKVGFWKEWDAAQTVAKSLPDLVPNSALVDQKSPALEQKHAELAKREDVMKAFSGVNTSIRYVDLRQVVAIQPSVQSILENAPVNEEQLLEYCFPLPRSPPCEVNVSFTPPIGQVMFLGDVPYMNMINMDARDGRLAVSPAMHVNFLQVVEFQNRVYLINGYHRAHSLLHAGKNVVPAWVLSGRPPVLAGAGFFNLPYLMNKTRPPLLQDFLGPVSVPYQQRLRRHGLLMRFEIAPFNVPL